MKKYYIMFGDAVYTGGIYTLKGRKYPELSKDKGLAKLFDSESRAKTVGFRIAIETNTDRPVKVGVKLL